MKVVISTLLLALTLSAGSQFDSFYAHSVEAKEKKDLGKELYNTNCAVCHHKDRIGLTGPPLIPAFLKKMKIKHLISKIRNGFPQTLMPKYEFLKTYELLAIARYIKSPVGEFSWGKEEIKNSIVTFKDKINPLPIKDIEQVLPVVERDGNRVWVMEGEKILSKFPLKNVHGGIKYTMNGENIYVPTRDGWVERYSLKEGRRVNRVRACINLRNVSLSRDGKKAFITCLLPEQMVVVDTMSLKPIKVTKLEGKVSALYEFYSKDEAVFTYRNSPKIGIVNTNTLKISYRDLKAPMEDFFIDPFEEYIIGTARRGKELSVYNLKSLKEVFRHKMEGMPHLFSATYWYKNGNFYFATPHIRKPYVTVWKMYDWKFEKQVNIGGDGFFVKTHPTTPYLWADNGGDELILIDKKDYKIKKLIPRKGKQYIHTEYSGDGKYTYLSIYERDGEIIVWDTISFKELASYPANIPVGKYNFINKNRQFYPRLFGTDLFKEKCSKCHNQKNKITTPFDKIEDYLKSKKDDKHSFDLNPHQLKSLLEYIKSVK